MLKGGGLKKKIIFIGNIGCGKTTLSQRILGEKQIYQKTQSVELRGDSIVDTPGEYLELNYFRGALMITSAEADVLGFVQSAIDDKRMFSPCYAGSFAKPAIGIVTKIDVATKEQIDEAEECLKMAGAERIFKVSCYKNKGIKELIKYLNE